MSENGKSPIVKSIGGIILIAALYFLVNGISLKEGAGLLGESILSETLQNMNIDDQTGNLGVGVIGLLLGGGMLTPSDKRRQMMQMLHLVSKQEETKTKSKK